MISAQSVPTPEPRRVERILRLTEVESCTGRKKTQIYGDIADGTFPAPIPTGARTVGWLESEIAAWQQARIAQGRGTRDAVAPQNLHKSARQGDGQEPRKT